MLSRPTTIEGATNTFGTTFGELQERLAVPLAAA
jgi:hypothetical protein